MSDDNNEDHPVFPIYHAFHDGTETPYCGQMREGDSGYELRIIKSGEAKWFNCGLCHDIWAMGSDMKGGDQ